MLGLYFQITTGDHAPRNVIIILTPEQEITLALKPEDKIAISLLDGVFVSGQPTPPASVSKAPVKPENGAEALAHVISCPPRYDATQAEQKLIVNVNPNLYGFQGKNFARLRVILAELGVTTVADLSALSKLELAGTSGIGPNMLAFIEYLLADYGLTLAPDKV